MEEVKRKGLNNVLNLSFSVVVKENPEAREVFAFLMIGENHELLSCVFRKDNEGGKEE